MDDVNLVHNLRESKEMVKYVDQTSVFLMIDLTSTKKASAVKHAPSIPSQPFIDNHVSKKYATDFKKCYPLEPVKTV